MFRSKKTATASFLFAAIVLSSCHIYQRYSMDMQRLDKVDSQSLNLYLLDAAHPYSRGWYVVSEHADGKGIEGFAIRMAEAEVLEVNHLRNRYDGAISRNDVLVYLDPDFATNLSDAAKVKLGKKEIVRIEVTEIDQVRSFAPCLLGCNAILFLAYLIGGNW